MYATIQVDLDGIWTIYQHHRVEVSHYPDPVFEQSISRFLELFGGANIKATFFIVGSDLERPAPAHQIKPVLEIGHELANHTYSHPLNFSQLTYAEKKSEIERAAHLIREITGQLVIGFRAPSYAIDGETLTILNDLHYLYDSSIFPTYWSGLLRRFESGFSVPRRDACIAATSYGKIQYSHAPNKIYHPDLEFPWKPGNLTLWEVPVSVYPLVRIPIHSSFSARLGWWYFASAINWLARLKRPVVFVFHGIDLVDRFEDNRIPKVKWILNPVEERMELFSRMIKFIRQKYEIVPTRELIKNIDAE
ncbi:MAG: polysaccharide deacetylase family protein [bacterium]|nr:polysaccharide deacetylase family protein [bacterium]